MYMNGVWISKGDSGHGNRPGTLSISVSCHVECGSSTCLNTHTFHVCVWLPQFLTLCICRIRPLKKKKKSLNLVCSTKITIKTQVCIITICLILIRVGQMVNFKENEISIGPCVFFYINKGSRFVREYISCCMYIIKKKNKKRSLQRCRINEFRNEKLYRASSVYRFSSGVSAHGSLHRQTLCMRAFVRLPSSRVLSLHCTRYRIISIYASFACIVFFAKEKKNFFNKRK